MRELERSRDDAKKAARVARHQPGKFLLRYGRTFDAKSGWNSVHFPCIRAAADQSASTADSAGRLPQVGGDPRSTTNRRLRAWEAGAGPERGSESLSAHAGQGEAGFQNPRSI